MGPVWLPVTPVRDERGQPIGEWAVEVVRKAEIKDSGLGIRVIDSEVRLVEQFRAEGCPSG